MTAQDFKKFGTEQDKKITLIGKHCRIESYYQDKKIYMTKFTEPFRDKNGKRIRVSKSVCFCLIDGKWTATNVVEKKDYRNGFMESFYYDDFLVGRSNISPIYFRTLVDDLCGGESYRVITEKKSILNDSGSIAGLESINITYFKNSGGFIKSYEKTKRKIYLDDPESTHQIKSIQFYLNEKKTKKVEDLDTCADLMIETTTEYKLDSSRQRKVLLNFDVDENQYGVIETKCGSSGIVRPSMMTVFNYKNNVEVPNNPFVEENDMKK